MMADHETLEHSTVFVGKVFHVERDRVRMPNGHEITVDVVRHPPSVVIVPMPEPGHVTLIRQFRYPVQRALWELAGGSVDEGETPEAAARRECHEEIGLVPDTVVRLGAFHPTPGYCDEEMIFFRASGLNETNDVAAVDEDEDTEPRTFPIPEAREMIRRGEITDMKTVVGLTLI
jgi:8-oxo-dGTP pyrophosphatase MutT (NUDIX family)